MQTINQTDSAGAQNEFPHIILDSLLRFSEPQFLL